jgi:hypothetical protein
MAHTFDGIDERLAEFVLAQPVFFVATAPLAGDGLINLSPKGLEGTFAVLDEHTVAYLDLTGSGVETIAHLQENGRVTLMFCAFTGKPRIVRLQGTGRAVFPGEAEFEALSPRFPDLPGIRSIIVVDVARVADSCGFGVPFMSYDRDRDALLRWANGKGPGGIAEYQAAKNARSLDGLPGVPVPAEGIGVGAHPHPRGGMPEPA